MVATPLSSNRDGDFIMSPSDFCFSAPLSGLAGIAKAMRSGVQYASAALASAISCGVAVSLTSGLADASGTAEGLPETDGDGSPGTAEAVPADVKMRATAVVPSATLRAAAHILLIINFFLL
ncbi:hypothetical protein [Streptomyces sp. C10]|uniref:hypothetical protein n=1 Tax=Streptomyces sp. C10 TaxID=531941 RepID=UPI00397FA2D9